MRQKRWRPRYRIAFKVVLATLSLAGAVYAADQIADPAGDGDIGKVISEQRVTDGQRVTGPTDEHQREKLRPEQMLELGTKYRQEMKDALEHAETVRIEAYRSRDIIRMTCIDDKISQMKTVIKIAEPRAADLHTLMGEEIVMQQHFSIVRQAHDRVNEISAELEDCSGDSPYIPAYIPRTAEQPATDTEVADPTRPPSPTQDVDRPSEASPYR
jgi:hypothetical protein